MKFWLGIVDSISSAVTPLFQRLFSTNVSLGDDATYTRSSDGTLVDFEGLVKTMPDNCARMQGARIVENLIAANTEDFSDAGWTNTNITVSLEQLTADAGNANIVEGYTAVAGDYVFSVKLRRITGTGNVQIAADDGTWTTVTLTGSYQRFSVQQTVAAGSKNAGIRIVTSGDEIEADEAQLELVEGQSNQNPSEYVSVGVLTSPFHGLGADGIKAFTTQNGNTVASNVVTEATGSAITGDIGLLMEPAATNITSYSNVYDVVTWSANNCTNAQDTTQDNPFQNTNARKITIDSSNTTHSTFNTSNQPTYVTATDYVFSCYIKLSSGTYFQFTFPSGRFGSNQFVTVNLSNGTVTESGSSNNGQGIEATGYNGWYRVWFSATSTSGGTGSGLIGVFSNTGTDGRAPSFLGNGTDEVFISEFQIETGTVPSSQIQTSGATATRNADALSYSGVATDNEVRYVADATYPFDTFVDIDVDDLDLSGGIPQDGMIKSITVYSPGERP